jgi:hypothetical protein
LRLVWLTAVNLQIVLCISVVIAILIHYDVLTCRLGAILLWHLCCMS